MSCEILSRGKGFPIPLLIVYLLKPWPGGGLLTLTSYQVYHIVQRERRPVSLGWPKRTGLPCIGKTNTGFLRMAVD